MKALGKFSTVTLSCLLLLGVTAQSKGGGLILVGTDPEPVPHGPATELFVPLFEALLDSVSNGQTGILAIGADPGTNAGNWIEDVASLMASQPAVTFVNDADIATIDFSNFAIIHIPSPDVPFTVGGITQTENDLLAARANAVACFLHSGGALFGLTQGDLANAWGFLDAIAPVTELNVGASGCCNGNGVPPPSACPAGSEVFNDVSATLAGMALGITDSNFDIVPPNAWHGVFETFPNFLEPFALANEPNCCSQDPPPADCLPVDMEAVIVGGFEVGCGDQDVCNGQETCDPAAGCQPGTPLECSDGLFCNGAETCDPLGGCQNGIPIPGCCKVDADCDNNNVCDGVEICIDNTCDSSPPLDCDDGNDCTADACGVDSHCDHTMIPDCP